MRYKYVFIGNHYQASAVILELIYVWDHTVGCGRSHRATWITLWSLGWTRIEDRVVLIFFPLNKDKIKANIIRHKNYFSIFVGYYSII